MDVRRVLLASTVACLGFAGSAALGQALAPDDDPEALAAEMARAKGPAKPWKHVRGFGRVLDLRKLPVVIDEPGLYAIDRNWMFEGPSGTPQLIEITADDVTLDLHGFEISAEIDLGGVLLGISGLRVEIRNGGLSACCEEATTLRATSGPHLHHLSVFSGLTMEFEGDGASLTDSTLSLRAEAEFAGGATVVRNTIACNRGRYCIHLLGDGNQVANNSLTLFQGGGIGVFGVRNVVASNVIDAQQLVDEVPSFTIQGDQNVVRANTVLYGASPVFAIGGTANTLDGNIVAPVHATARARVGVEFTRDGNFYGNNRMAAQVPFALGGTVQTDWGGNVGY